MEDRTSHSEEERWRIIVVGAEDVAQHLRKAGHRVLAMEQLPVLGIGSADAAVLELGRVDARSANRFRAKLVEPVVIHRRRADRPLAFLSIGRRQGGELRLDLVEEAVQNAVVRTRLLRRLDEQEADCDAPTEILTLELPRASRPKILDGDTVIARRLRSLEGA